MLPAVLGAVLHSPPATSATHSPSPPRVSVSVFRALDSASCSLLAAELSAASEQQNGTRFLAADAAPTLSLIHI